MYPTCATNMWAICTTGVLKVRRMRRKTYCRYEGCNTLFLPFVITRVEKRLPVMQQFQRIQRLRNKWDFDVLPKNNVKISQNQPCNAVRKVWTIQGKKNDVFLKIYF